MTQENPYRAPDAQPARANRSCRNALVILAAIVVFILGLLLLGIGAWFTSSSPMPRGNQPIPMNQPLPENQLSPATDQ